jgi:glycosyltransferase involved in cell wall biosynthesis
MRIFHIISSINLKYGGPSRFVLDLAVKQNKMFQDSSICTTFEEHDNEKLIQKDSFLKKKIIGFKTNIFHSIRYSQGFKNFIDHHIEQYDIIHIHGLYRFPVTYAAFVARKKKFHIL